MFRVYSNQPITTTTYYKGPDHISALAALCAGETSGKAFFAGFRWGMGHSTGLILVTAVFLSVEPKVMEELTHWCEWIVGFLMIALGVWTMWRAYKPGVPHAHGHGAAITTGIVVPVIKKEDTKAADGATPLPPPFGADDLPADFSATVVAAPNDEEGGNTASAKARGEYGGNHEEDEENTTTTTEAESKKNEKRWHNCSSPKELTEKLVSFVVGVVHG